MMQVAKKYMQTELGLIPVDWEVKEFVEVMDGFSSGHVDRNKAVIKFLQKQSWIDKTKLVITVQPPRTS